MNAKNLLAALIISTSAYGQALISADDTLDNWNIKGPEVCWSLKDGVITGSNDPGKKGGILWTKADYRNFTLTGEFKFSGKIDSGIFIRREGDQIQIGISGSLKRDMTGSPYIAEKRSYPVEADGVAKLLKTDDWNTFTLAVTGGRYIFELNGKQVLDYTSETAIEEGPIGFQVHPGVEMKIEFRKLVVSSEKP
jgi:hypothetical protein